ncbi:MAG: hypothetical protein ABI647_10855 [Gemmatimonadota bacterium]
MNDLVSTVRILAVSAAVALATYRLVPAPRVAEQSAKAALAPQSEVQRVQADLLAAEEGLRQRDVSRLTTAQQANRAHILALLERYRERAQFPKVDALPDQRVAYFRDADGTLSAVAFLLVETGRAGLVNRLVEARSGALARNLADYAELASWARGHGLTVEEVDRIQLAFQAGTLQRPGVRAPDAATSTVPENPRLAAPRKAQLRDRVVVSL